MTSKKSKISFTFDNKSLPVEIDYEGKKYLLKSTKEKKLHMSKKEKVLDKN